MSQNWLEKYLIFLERTVWHRSISFFLKRNNNKGDKNVDKKERKDNEEYDVENADFHPEARLRALPLIRWFNRIP